MSIPSRFAYICGKRSREENLYFMSIFLSCSHRTHYTAPSHVMKRWHCTLITTLGSWRKLSTLHQWLNRGKNIEAPSSTLALNHFSNRTLQLSAKHKLCSQLYSYHVCECHKMWAEKGNKIFFFSGPFWYYQASSTEKEKIRIGKFFW